MPSAGMATSAVPIRKHPRMPDTRHIERRPAPALVVLALAGLLSACAGPGGSVEGAEPAASETSGISGTSTAPAAERVARGGTFERRIFLTGSLEAARAEYIQVPRTPNWQVDLRWLEEDGAQVSAGDPVVELDDSAFANDIEEKETALAEQLAELERRRAETLGEIRQREFEVERARAELAKAELEADLPEGIVPRQEMEERALARDRAEIELAKAEAELASYHRSSAADLEVLEIDIRKARREIDTARAAIDDLKIAAPVDGVFLRGDHPWHGRKIQVGDNAWVGLTLATLPDLSSLVVEARLPDVDDGDVAPGMEAVVTLDAYPDETFRGTVREIAPVAQEEEGTSTRRFFKTLIELADLEPQFRERLIPGMSARVEVIAEVEAGSVGGGR
jgi:multidrug efflux pump subunit AcrA (membrane-fusion protein)